MKTIRVISIVCIIILSYSTASSQSAWISQTSGTTETLNSVSFSGTQTGWAAGNNGTVLNTINGGATWSSENAGVTSNFNSVYFVNSSTGWIVGALGIIEKTSDGGAHWNTQQSGFANLTLYSVYFTSALTGFAVGFEQDLGPSIAKTTNGGALWTKVNYDLPAANTFNSVRFPSSSTGWIVTGGGRIYTTSNGFILNPQVSGVTGALTSVFFTDNFSGYISGAGGVILKTTNGSTWSQVQSGVNADLKSIFFPNSSTGWACGSAGTILQSTNNGTNWSPQSSGTNLTLRSIVFANSLTGWAVGDSGTIINTTSGGTLTGISQTSNSMPVNNNLSQNFPNPFNPSTAIKFDIPNTGDNSSNSVTVRLVVYNVLGKIAATLVDGELKPGSYRIDWNASNLPSGAYYYRLTAGNFSQTKEMILLK